jgi:hypothetical protein
LLFPEAGFALFFDILGVCVVLGHCLGEESVELYLCEESVLVDGADQSAMELWAVLALQINENSSDSRVLLHVVSRFFAIRANIAVTSSLNPHPYLKKRLKSQKKTYCSSSRVHFCGVDRLSSSQQHLTGVVFGRPSSMEPRLEAVAFSYTHY